MPYENNTNKGILDGLTILRFAHAYESGGGVEQHLSDLNQALSKRNSLTTIQMQLTTNIYGLSESEEKIGDALLVKIPLLVNRRENAEESDYKKRVSSQIEKLKLSMLNILFYNYALNSLFMRTLVNWRKVPQRTGEPTEPGNKVKEILYRYKKIDLVILHASGGSDAMDIIRVAKNARIPTAIIHHFSNDKLSGLSLRQQISLVDGVAGASLVGVPSYLKKSFWNLSDAVDTEFYKLENVNCFKKKYTYPVIYTPARVIPEKGQADVIKAASILKRKGIETNVVFAGRIDSISYEDQLRKMVAERCLSDSVEFLGPLSLAEYRDFYSIAHVMVMPTYHNEGMPRTLIDSQAMKVPPIVYDVGGTKEGIIDNKTGFLVKRGDVNGVVLAIESLIQNSKLHHRMAEAGRKYVEKNFSLNAFAARHEKFYSQVIKNAALVQKRF